MPALSQQAGDHKAAMNKRESMTTQDINNTNDPQKKYRLGMVSKNILLEEFNQFYFANLAKGQRYINLKPVWGFKCVLLFQFFKEDVHICLNDCLLCVDYNERS